jgi:hypothetical protein
MRSLLYNMGHVSGAVFILWPPLPTCKWSWFLLFEIVPYRCKISFVGKKSTYDEKKKYRQMLYFVIFCLKNVWFNYFLLWRLIKKNILSWQKTANWHFWQNAHNFTDRVQLSSYQFWACILLCILALFKFLNFVYFH